MSSFRSRFPFFSTSNEVYLDTAATSQRLDASLTAMQEYYHSYNANVHRGTYTSARNASNKYEQSRHVIAQFLGARSSSEIVFTSGTTDAINIVANGLNASLLKGREIIVCESEHHANLLPWQQFAARHNLKLTRICLDENGTFNQHTLQRTLSALTPNVAILAIAHVSNALGNVYPVEALCKQATVLGVISVIDGTQAAAHIDIDVKQFDCDFYAISGHKMYAGTGIGALYGKFENLETLAPSRLGGEIIRSVTWDTYTLQAPPGKFEAGTPNIAGAIGMAKAATFIKQNILKIKHHEQTVLAYLVGQLTFFVDNKHLVLLGNISLGPTTDRTCSATALISFYSPSVHANDIASHLSTSNIAVRAGHHCAMPLMQSLDISGSVRVSVGCYTSHNDIDMLIASLKALFDDKASMNTGTPNKLTHVEETEVISQSIAQSVLNVSNWNEKHRLLLLNSKKLALLKTSHRDELSEIIGCEANVWLALIDTSDNRQRLHGYSDSKVIRGLLALMIEKVNALEISAVSSFNFDSFLSEIGLSHYFSEGRRDGIRQIIKRIKLIYA